ncbi:pentapeptide repeat-containing protein [Amycolatopsis sp. NPDC051371]|uniref:pentapeptide repeat-containing protein n=1 Tax=Amycolatopsis sp. NPDC051371 TaxID=3155800 RepID=UPI00342563D6
MTVDPPASALRGRSLPGTWWGIALIIAVPVVLLAAAAIVVLLLTVRPTDAKERIELIKAGLGVGAGTGGVVALVLTGRRQWATEDANRVTELDAIERRATELYAKAAEQLGSDYAPVRLAGFYALERLADTHPVQQQTVANLLCAYLRMPFDHRGEPTDVNGPDPTFRVTAAHQQEREVRLTAQTILTDHLATDEHPDAPVAQRWEEITLNLAGATLIDFKLQYSWLARATFAGATFTGDLTEFTYTMFEGHTLFLDTTFLAPVSFRGTNFADFITFSRATFQKRATFNDAVFEHQVYFNDATFAGETDFAGSTFSTRISRPPGVQFDRARFEDTASFREVTVADTQVTFTGTTFATVNFDGAEFDQGVIGLKDTSAVAQLAEMDSTTVSQPLG